MGCFLDYYRTVSEDTCGPACSLDAAATLAGCVRRQVLGSGPLYHPLESAAKFTEAENKQALALADRAKALAKKKGIPDNEHEALQLSDDLHTFVLKVLEARGTVHSGPPKSPK